MKKVSQKLFQDMADDKKALGPTIDEGKRLWGLVSQYARLELVDKLTFILTLLLIGGILLGLCTVAIYCFSMYIVTKLAEQTGNLAASYCIVGGALLLIALLVWMLRSVIVTKPIIKSLMNKFFNEE